MKTPTLFGFIFILLSTGFTNVATGQEYTYRLTVTSLSEEEQSFNVEISSKIGSSAEPITMVLSDQTTPFERILETGEHVVIVEHQEEQGLVESKITGIVDGETKGSASADYRHTILKAGPGGRYSASQ
jgi:hypothetical protein